MNVTFRKAVPADLDAIAQIYDQIHTLEEEGKVTIGWDRAIYPTRKTAAQSIADGDMFVELDGDTIVASARINQEQVPEYALATWENDAPAEKVMVIHTLTVDPELSRRGYGRAMVAYYESYAAEAGCPYLRMDTNERNTRARAMYRTLGYHEVGIVPCVFNGIEGVHLVCLEKKL